MPMKNPPHIGQVIWHGILEPLDLSITKAAGILGVRRATLSDLVNGKAALTAEMALRIHKAFGPDVDHLLQCECQVAQRMMLRKCANGMRVLQVRCYLTTMRSQRRDDISSYGIAVSMNSIGTLNEVSNEIRKTFTGLNNQVTPLKPEPPWY